MVATSQPMATAVALDILRRGGNAMDAAIAASATLCVTEPFSTGIGGDCFLLYHEAASNRLFGLNGSGRAPIKASIEEIGGRGYTTMPERGILSVTVPGAVDAWQTALERFGTMDFTEVLQPAIQFAQDGFAVTEVVAATWQMSESLLASSDGARRTYLLNGKAPSVGSCYRQPNLARSLKRIADHGRKAFYEGEIAEKIVRFSDEHDGLLQLDDFALHTSDWVQPINTEYRGVRVYEIPPNGQGITALMMLNILENTALREMVHLSAESVHIYCEAFKLALSERDRFVADSTFNTIPVDALLSKQFAKKQFSRIDPDQCLAHPPVSGLPHHRDTICLTVVDENRNAVSLINSLFWAWGSGLVAGNTGITLQNRGSGFVLEHAHSNSLAPRKRPLHTIIPAMVYQDEQPILSFGVMGGHYQAMGHCYVLSNWLDFDMDLQEAVDAPRFLPEDGALKVERGVPYDARIGLQNRGHHIVEVDAPLGGAQCIYIDWENGVLQASSDARKDGCALGY